MRRVSILQLMGVISILAIGIAALRHPSALWANALFSAALAACTLAVLAAIYRRGAHRAFAVGFATCGWAYLLLSFGPWVGAFTEPRLITTAALDLLFHQIVPPEPAPPGPPAGGMGGMGMGGGMMGGAGMMSRGMMGGGMMGGMGGPIPDTPADAWNAWNAIDRQSIFKGMGSFAITASAAYLRCGHSALALLCATLGGVFARRAYDAGKRDDVAGPPA